MEFWILGAKVFAGTKNHGPRKKQILNGIGKRQEDGEYVSRERTREPLSLISNKILNSVFIIAVFLSVNEYSPSTQHSILGWL